MKYDNPKAGEWVFPKRKGYKMMCCDCGLVHIFNFRIKNRHIEFQVFRDERATSAARRKK